jgi:SseB protein N-terminal domain
MSSLDQAFLAMQSGDEAAALQFYRLLADAQLILLLQHEPEGDQIAPQVYDLSDGPVLLAFDSEDRLAAFAEGPAPYVSLPGRVIAGMMSGQGLWLGLNLGTGAASETLLPPDAMTHLLSLLDVTPVQTEARAQGFSAPVVPDALDAALLAVFARISGLAVAAVLVGVAYEGRVRGHVLAIIGAQSVAEPDLARAIAEALAFAGLEAATLDVTFMAPEDPGLAQMVRLGRVYEVPAPVAPPEPAIPASPGFDPTKPPRLR